MRIVSYSGESVLTTDGVGEAVVDYARALIADNSTDVVDIPVVFDDEEVIASMVIGPASQLIVVPAKVNDFRLRDELTIKRIRAKIAALGPHRILPTQAVPVSHDDLSYDFL
jgi:hypothetical protein